MTTIEAEVKQLLTDVVLISYDIPASENTLRHRFLREVALHGGMQHTASCYLVPFSEDILEWANQLESAGHAVVWVSKQPDQKTAVAITAKYDDHLKTRCLGIDQKLVFLQEQIEAGRLKRAQNTAERILKMLQELSKISDAYNPPWLKPKIAELGYKLKEVYEHGQEGS